MRSKWCSLIRFWRILTKKDRVECVKHTYVETRMVGIELTIFGNIIGTFYNISLADYYTSIRGFIGVSTHIYSIYIFTCTYNFRPFFHGSGTGFFRSGSGPGLRKRSQSWSGSGQKNPDPKHCLLLNLTTVGGFLAFFPAFFAKLTFLQRSEVK